MYQWCGFKSRRGKNKNLTALKSNSNTVWFNFQTYIYVYIYSITFIWTSFTNSYKSESMCQGFQECIVACASHLFYNVRTCISLLFCRNIEKNWQIILQRAPKITQLHDKIIFYFKYNFGIRYYWSWQQKTQKRKFKQWWSAILSISTNWTITSHLKSLNKVKITTYDIGNPGHGLHF